MNKLNEFINLYKTNKSLFNKIVFVVNIVLIFWQGLFSLITPSRGNILALFILISALVYQLIKNP